MSDRCKHGIGPQLPCEWCRKDKLKKIKEAERAVIAAAEVWDNDGGTAQTTFDLKQAIDNLRRVREGKA